ncbi:MAG: tetraacyldisaccharide 4'-kinase, partial [Candidatus Binataceae bacterium]
FWRAFRNRANVTTIGIGNLTVGGSGKTPFALFLANRLLERGAAVAIASRGYGRTGKHAMLVSDGSELNADPGQAGDEPAMMARAFAGPIAVAKRRIDAIELLRNLGPLDVVVLDDAFQHARLACDINLLVINAQQGFGNGWILPAGPMREPPSAARRADAIILILSGDEHGDPLTRRQRAKLGSAPRLGASLRPRSLVYAERGKWREAPLALAGRRIVAVSGLANPAGFYAMLRKLDADLVGVLEFPDHHAYSSSDWQAIAAASRDGALLVTTEKDLVKLERFPFARDSLYALRLEVAMSDSDLAALDELINARVRSPHIAASA